METETYGQWIGRGLLADGVEVVVHRLERDEQRRDRLATSSRCDEREDRGGLCVQVLAVEIREGAVPELLVGDQQCAAAPTFQLRAGVRHDACPVEREPGERGDDVDRRLYALLVHRASFAGRSAVTRRAHSGLQSHALQISETKDPEAGEGAEGVEQAEAGMKVVMIERRR